MIWNSEYQYLQMIVVFATLLAGIWIVRKLDNKEEIETFQQKKPFLLREDNEVYDPFYIEKYDDLYKTNAYSEEDIITIIHYTTPSTSDSTFLDIGCGSGSLLKMLEEKQYATFGIDKSRFMVEQAQENLNNSEVICDDILRDPMLYENNTFSHILCTHFTLYEIEDKNTFFQHCFFWLRSGGYLAIHIVDPDNFKKIVPRSELYQNVSDTTVKNTSMNTHNYLYSNEYHIDKNEHNIWRQKESFKSMNNVRQNEKKMFMTPKQEIFDIALRSGFIVHSESNYEKTIKDRYQYLVIFTKPMCGNI
jgi:SAM-dependent methyltransferase